MRSSSKEGLNCAEVLVAPEAGGGNLKVCSERLSFRPVRSEICRSHICLGLCDRLTDFDVNLQSHWTIRAERRRSDGVLVSEVSTGG